MLTVSLTTSLPNINSTVNNKLFSKVTNFFKGILGIKGLKTEISHNMKEWNQSGRCTTYMRCVANAVCLIVSKMKWRKISGAI